MKFRNQVLARITVLLIASLSCQFALAEGAASVKTTKAVSSKKNKKSAPVAAPVVSDEDDIVPDIKQSNSHEYQCELSNSLTIYTNAEDDAHIALRWKKKLYRLKRVDTSTGANRFENRKAGFVWIGIPAKSMLLDSKKGRQLANECRTAEQAAPTKPAEPVLLKEPESAKS